MSGGCVSPPCAPPLKKDPKSDILPERAIGLRIFLSPKDLTPLDILLNNIMTNYQAQCYINNYPTVAVMSNGVDKM